MKKWSFLFFTALLPLLAFAQNMYTDMLMEGKTWHYLRGWPLGNAMTEGVRGDTVIAGRACKQYGWVGNDNFFTRAAFLCQEDDKIYSVDGETGALRLLYDFGASAGDVIIWGNKEAKLTVTATGVVRARGHELRTVTFVVTEEWTGDEWTTVEDSYPQMWIEGMGSSSGPLAGPRPDIAGVANLLLNVTCNGELLYDSDIFSVTDFEKMMLNYQPEWEYNRLYWNEAKRYWGRGESCHAIKTGSELPSPMNFIYSVITIHEKKESKLYLRQGDKVYAKKDSYREYMKKVLPEGSDFFEEQADWYDDVVLYDFSLNEGDRYPCCGDVTVESVIQVMTRDGCTRKLLLLSNGLGILEGIGCLNSSLGVFAYQSDPGARTQENVRDFTRTEDAETGPCMLSFRKYGNSSNPIFAKGDLELRIAPIEAESLFDAPTYDLQGRPVTNPQKGIYVKEGKKVLVK